MKDQELTLFYDGDCPLCSREVKWLRRRDAAQRLCFVDIASPEFDAGQYGLEGRDVRKHIHAVRSDGTVLVGMEVFRTAYRKLGLGWLTAPTGWPVLRPLFDRLYSLFARNRERLGNLVGRRAGRTPDEDCQVCARDRG